MNTRSIEFRLTLWYGAMLSVGFGLFALLLWLTVSRGVRDSVDELLFERASRLDQTLQNEVASDLGEESEEEVSAEIEENLIEILRSFPESQLARVRDRGALSEIYPAAGEAPLPWSTLGQGEVVTLPLEGVPHRVLATRIEILERDFDVQLASSLAGLGILRSRFLVIAWIMIPLAVLICFGLGWTLSRAALRPLDRLADATAEIGVRNLQTSLSVPDTGDSLERLSRSFNDMLARLAHSVERIEQFSADASHELRSPLAVIKTTAELALKRERTTDEYRADLRSIQNEVDSLSELVDVLLSLARADAAEKDAVAEGIPRMEVDLRAIAERVVAALRPEVEGEGLKLRLETAATPALVFASEPALRRLTGSLVENALSHTETGWIAVRVSTSAEGHELIVSDSGEGIPPESVPRIFDRFYRADPSRSRSDRLGRFGMGLAIVRRIAELHRARIDVESRLGEGSTFRVVFPAAP